MKDKCLILDFKNAGLFIPDFKDKHRMIENEEVSDRKGSNRFIRVPFNTLLKEHVANVLLVLSGERPVPTVRKHGLFLKEDTSITNLANDAKVEIKEGIYTSKKGEIKLLQEVIAITKPLVSRKTFDSAINLRGLKIMKSIVPSWEKIKWHLGLDLFSEFEKMVISVLGKKAKDMNMIKVFEELYRSQDKKVKDFCNLAKVPKPYRMLLIKGKTKDQEIRGGFPGFTHWHFSNYTHGLEKTTKLSGRIYVPVNDSDLEKINKGSGYATLLDGGLVTIFDVVTNSEPLYNNAQPVFKRSA